MSTETQPLTDELNNESPLTELDHLLSAVRGCHPQAVNNVRAYISALKADLAQALEALKECADEAEAYIEQYYARTKDNYPSEKRRYDRDMEPVLKARKILSGERLTSLDSTKAGVNGVY